MPLKFFIRPGISGKKPVIEQPGVETFQGFFPRILESFARCLTGLKNQLPDIALKSLFDENGLGLITGLTANKGFNYAVDDINQEDKERIFKQLHLQLTELFNRDMSVEAPLFAGQGASLPVSTMAKTDPFCRERSLAD